MQAADATYPVVGKVTGRSGALDLLTRQLGFGVQAEGGVCRSKALVPIKRCAQHAQPVGVATNAVRIANLLPRDYRPIDLGSVRRKPLGQQQHVSHP